VCTSSHLFVNSFPPRPLDHAINPGDVVTNFPLIANRNKVQQDWSRCSQDCRAPPQHVWPWFVACLRSIRSSALHHTNLLRKLLRHASSALHHTNLLRKLLRHASSALHHTNLLRKLLRHARLVQNTSNRASPASINETNVRCMDAAWRGAEGSSTKQPGLYDCRRSFHVARAAMSSVTWSARLPMTKSLSCAFVSPARHSTGTGRGM